MVLELEFIFLQAKARLFFSPNFNLYDMETDSSVNAE